MAYALFAPIVIIPNSSMIPIASNLQDYKGLASIPKNNYVPTKYPYLQYSYSRRELQALKGVRICTKKKKKNKSTTVVSFSCQKKRKTEKDVPKEASKLPYCNCSKHKPLKSLRNFL